MSKELVRPIMEKPERARKESSLTNIAAKKKNTTGENTKNYTHDTCGKDAGAGTG